MAPGNLDLAGRTLQKIIARTLRREEAVLKREDTFKQLGADSMAVVQILVALEEALDIDLKDEDLKTIENMGGFIDYIAKKTDERKTSQSGKRGTKWRIEN
jgi:acyl carrier protein